MLHSFKRLNFFKNFYCQIVFFHLSFLPLPPSCPHCSSFSCLPGLLKNCFFGMWCINYIRTIKVWDIHHVFKNTSFFFCLCFFLKKLYSPLDMLVPYGEVRKLKLKGISNSPCFHLLYPPLSSPSAVLVKLLDCFLFLI